jgi:hypothetical protein
MLSALESKPGLRTTWVSTQTEGPLVVVVSSARVVEIVADTRTDVVVAAVKVVAKLVRVGSDTTVEEISATLLATVVAVGRHGLAWAPRMQAATPTRAKIEWKPIFLGYWVDRKWTYETENSAGGTNGRWEVKRENI